MINMGPDWYPYKERKLKTGILIKTQMEWGNSHVKTGRDWSDAAVR